MSLLQRKSANGVHPSPAASATLLFACLIAFAITYQEALPSTLARQISWVWLGAIGGSLLLESRKGVRFLLRSDLLAILALYFLLYFEFLFPQTHFDTLVVGAEAASAMRSTQWGLAAFVLGRHLPLQSHSLSAASRVYLGTGAYMGMLVIAFMLSHLPMLTAVGFDLRQLWHELLGPRFGRSWGRGRYGDMGSLFHELQLFGYVVPPLAGYIFAKRMQYSGALLILVGALLLFHFGIAFSSGTRNTLAIYCAAFWAGYVLINHHLAIHFVIIGSSILLLVFLVLAAAMLQFRESGLREWMSARPDASDWVGQTFTGTGEAVDERSGFQVDYNLWRLTQMQMAFPDSHPYLGWNVLYVALTKPVPRGLWPTKPRGLKVELESVIGAEGYTIACTWIGEAYVAGGLVWIVMVGLCIGAFCRAWNALLLENCAFQLILFASGAYAILLLMRSLMFFTTALLPCLALLVLGLLFQQWKRSVSGGYAREWKGLLNG
jgi:hypothetical protein